MTNRLLSIALGAFLLSAPMMSFGQSPLAPALGKSKSFAAFTSAGLVTNVGVTTITGDVGTDAETFDGFNTVAQVGTLYEPGPITAAVKVDVLLAYANLFLRTSNSPLGATIGTTDGPVIETLTPQVYATGGAAVINGDLIIDAEGDPNAVFIIKINGALSVAEDAEIILANQASASNVYFQVNGAVAIAANAVFNGTILAEGAISLAQGAVLNGRALSTAGAINLNNNVIFNVSASLPVTLTSFTAKKGENQTALLNWSTTAETNSDRFEIEHSINGKMWNKIATLEAKGESSVLSHYQYSDAMPERGTNLYRLKMIDRDATFAYSRIRSLEFVKDARTVLYPNPAIDKLTLDVDDLDQVERIQMNDILGRVVYDQTKTASVNMSANVDVANLPTGMYMVRVTRSTGPVTVVKILKR